MIINGTCGNQTVSSLDELLHLLRDSRKGVLGEFWLGENEDRKGHPTLVIYINNDLACLHYFPGNRDPGFQAVGDNVGGQVTFAQEGQGDFSVPRRVVVGVEQAYQAAASFFQSRGLPSCIEWAEL